MNWIFATISMMLVSVVMYSFIRLSKQFAIPPIINTFAMISLPLPLYGIWLLFTDITYTPTLTELVVMGLQGLVLIYYGNLYALRGITDAPNPGYSVLISKLYVVFTAPASILLFDSSLSSRSMIGITAIVIFSYFVLVDSKTKKTPASNSWIVSTLIAFLCFGGIALSSKYLLNSGVPILVRLILPGILASLLYLSAANKAFATMRKTPQVAVLLIGVALCSVGFNYLMQYAFANSPNVGLVNAANAASTALLAVTSAVFFHDDLSKRKLLGIAGVLVGLYLLFV